MIKSSLEIFVNAAIENGDISSADVHRLQRDVLPDGIESRDEADVLIALDRAIVGKPAAWSAFVIQAVVDFVVWTTRPTGAVDRDTAQWLVSSLSCGVGPTDVALAIAFETVRESELCDEALVAFVMRWTRGRAHDFHMTHDAELAA